MKIKKIKRKKKHNEATRENCFKNCQNGYTNTIFHLLILKKKIVCLIRIKKCRRTIII